jgi:hypothetical protein
VHSILQEVRPGATIITKGAALDGIYILERGAFAITGAEVCIVLHDCINCSPALITDSETGGLHLAVAAASRLCLRRRISSAW